jgi:hypothetical protein
VLLRARVLSLQSDPEPAPVIFEALSTLIVESERRERVTPVIEASILRAYAQHAISQHDAVVESLSHAFTLGAQSGYIRIFADEGRQLLHLIEQYRNKLHAPHAYVEEIHNLIHKELAAQSALPKLHRDDASAVEGQQLTPLTRRELDILQLLAAGKSNQEIATEVDNVFRLFESRYYHPEFKNLIVSPFHTRKFFIDMLQNEINNAKAGKEAWAIIKINSIVDKKIATKLYEASQAGVKLRLIVRGICVLIQGIDGISENLEIISTKQISICLYSSSTKDLKYKKAG